MTYFGKFKHFLVYFLIHFGKCSPKRSLWSAKEGVKEGSVEHTLERRAVWRRAWSAKEGVKEGSVKEGSVERSLERRAVWQL